MKEIIDVVQFEVGSPQFRIQTSGDKSAPEFRFYGQNELEADLRQVHVKQGSVKTIRTFDSVSIVKEGDLIFSLISGTATLVSSAHEGYLLTQNYVKLVPERRVAPGYLLYVLNEDKAIKRQFHRELQGTATIKYTVKQLKSLRLPDFPDYQKQKLIGEFYRNQLHLEALEKRLATRKTKRRLLQLKEVK